ncbi:MAG TPA: hypothetical protein VHK70_09020 [Burkholderiaceae bacterium]|nr:hypothetical protein [Burkholderiaceae bacterium]
MAAALDKGFAFDGVAVVLVPTFDAVLVAAFGDALPEVFPIAALGFTTLALPEGFAAVVFFTAGFAVAFRGAGLAAADFVLFAADVRDFAGFFIAFAMESIPVKVVPLRLILCEK